MWARHGRGFPHPGGGGKSGRRRMFGGDELRLVLLKLIADQPRHGYDLIRDIEARTGGAYAPSPGVVYPTLTLLADTGLIDEAPMASGGGGARKLFAVTDAGHAVLAEKSEEVAALFARLAVLGAARARSDAAPVRRAMGNLRTELQARMSPEGVTADIQYAVATLLDEVAQKIERS
ncbi:MAG TPA: PadR family transcriptional regulator [Sphingomonadaceae bacterium]|nr:PadR family transcriptional regulator [Sphingomonadaceae bacterium]